MTATWPAGLARAWHPIAYARDLGDTPMAVRLMDRHLVLFRSSDGAPALLQDRCPHRGAPLSAGRMANGQIECPYHGWRFDGGGQCRLVAGSRDVARHAVPNLPVKEAAGLIWTTLADDLPEFPQLPGEISDPGSDHFWWHLPASRGAIADAIENLLDPIHSYFLHPGLVRRTRNPQGVDIDFTVTAEGADARYTETRTDMTLLQRLTEGDRVASWGRYRAPTQVQIMFEDSRGIHAAISVIFSPVGQLETRPYACFSTRRGRLPAWLKRWIIIAFHRRVLDQDLHMLGLQADQNLAFGGPDYHDGPVDMFGAVVWTALNNRPLTPQHRQFSLTSGD